MTSTLEQRDVRGKKVSVIGAARSGLAAASLLRDQGARVFVSDSQPPEKLKDQISTLTSMGIEYEAGVHSERVYDTVLMVISPGVPPTAPVIRQAVQRGIRIVSELELASWFCPAKIIAVTGSNGKTTTTTLLGRMFSDAKRKHVVGGNIGTAFSSQVPDLQGDSVAVLEVSSFQLDHIERFHPKVSVILNITPDHLDRYGGSFENYSQSKCRVFENQSADDYCICCYDDDETKRKIELKARSHVHVLPFSCDRRFSEGAFVENGTMVTVMSGKRTEIIGVGEMSIKGIHNLYNAMGATLAAQVMGIDAPSIRATLKNFKGVEHRLEFVRELNGIRFINDSKATNIASVWYALQAYPDPVVLLLGGRDKGNDYSALADLVKTRVRAIVAIGESAEKVVKNFQSIAKVVTASSMENAVQTARALAGPGEIVLLSPACASFDWFDNYEHRGREFKRCVMELK